MYAQMMVVEVFPCSFSIKFIYIFGYYSRDCGREINTTDCMKRNIRGERQERNGENGQKQFIYLKESSESSTGGSNLCKPLHKSSKS